jgi:hypothetical protein
MSQEKLKKILEDYLRLDPKTRLTTGQTIQAILQWFKEEIVPKEREPSYKSESGIPVPVQLKEVQKVWNTGYNEALKDILTNLTKEG